MTTQQNRSQSGVLTRVIAGIMERFFYLLYHQFAWTYDLIAWAVSLGQWQTWVNSVIPYIHTHLVLELGHGPGHLQAALSREGIRSIGLDLSKQMGRLAHRRLDKTHPQPALVNARSQQLPFAGCNIPQIVATFPSEYIVDPQTLTEIYRVLAPGGSTVVLLYAWLSGRNVIEKLAAWLFRVTGESPVWNDSFLNPARAAGFFAKSEIIVLPKSRLLILHFIKPT